MQGCFLSCTARAQRSLQSCSARGHKSLQPSSARGRKTLQRSSHTGEAATAPDSKWASLAVRTAVRRSALILLSASGTVLYTSVPLDSWICTCEQSAPNQLTDAGYARGHVLAQLLGSTAALEAQLSLAQQGSWHGSIQTAIADALMQHVGLDKSQHPHTFLPAHAVPQRQHLEQTHQQQLLQPATVKVESAQARKAPKPAAAVNKPAAAHAGLPEQATAKVTTTAKDCTGHNVITAAQRAPPATVRDAPRCNLGAKLQRAGCGLPPTPGQLPGSDTCSSAAWLVAAGATVETSAHSWHPAVRSETHCKQSPQPQRLVQSQQDVRAEAGFAGKAPATGAPAIAAAVESKASDGVTMGGATPDWIADRRRSIRAFGSASGACTDPGPKTTALLQNLGLEQFLLGSANDIANTAAVLRNASGACKGPLSAQQAGRPHSHFSVECLHHAHSAGTSQEGFEDLSDGLHALLQGLKCTASDWPSDPQRTAFVTAEHPQDLHDLRNLHDVTAEHTRDLHGRQPAAEADIQPQPCTPHAAQVTVGRTFTSSSIASQASVIQAAGNQHCTLTSPGTRMRDSSKHADFHGSSKHACMDTSNSHLGASDPSDLSVLRQQVLHEGNSNATQDSHRCSSKYEPQLVVDVTIEAIPDPDDMGQGLAPPLLLITCQNQTVRNAAEALFMQLTETQLGMISQMFPLHVVEQLTRPDEHNSLAFPAAHKDVVRSHQDVTILFMDVVNFTNMCKEVDAIQVMSYVNELFSLLDDLVTHYGLHKVETAGDCYIVSAGVLEHGPGGFLQVVEHHKPAESARTVLDFAKGMLHASSKVLMPHNHAPTQVRVGIHTGNCLSGLVGSQLPKWSIYGDSINTASRMESTGVPGRIQVSAATHDLLPEADWEERHDVVVKGKSTGVPGRIQVSAATHDLLPEADWEERHDVVVKGKGTMRTYLWVSSTIPSATAAEPAQSAGHGSTASLTGLHLQLDPWLSTVQKGDESMRSRHLGTKLSAWTPSERTSVPSPRRHAFKAAKVRRASACMVEHASALLRHRTPSGHSGALPPARSWDSPAMAAQAMGGCSKLATSARVAQALCMLHERASNGTTVPARLCTDTSFIVSG